MKKNRKLITLVTIIALILCFIHAIAEKGEQVTITSLSSATQTDLQPTTQTDLQPATQTDLPSATPTDLQPSTQTDLPPATPTDLQPSTPSDLNPVTTPIAISEENFPDQTFRNYISRFNLNNDEFFDVNEILAIKTIEVNSSMIKTFKGIEYFSALENFFCSGCYYTTLLDLRSNAKLKNLDCSNCRIESLLLPESSELITLHCGGNLLQTLNVDHNPALVEFSCNGNLLSSINTSKNLSLRYLNCQNNQLASLDVSNNLFLSELRCCDNKFSIIYIAEGGHIDYLVNNSEPYAFVGCFEWSSGTYPSDDYMQLIIDDNVLIIPKTYHEHILVERFKRPTATETGHKPYWECLECKKLFNDAEGNEEIATPVIIPALRNMRVLVLPSQIKIIEEEALSGLNCEAVLIPNGCETIGKKAFAKCDNLLYVYIPVTVTSIAPDAFEDCDNIFIDKATE